MSSSAVIASEPIPRIVRRYSMTVKSDTIEDSREESQGNETTMYYHIREFLRYGQQQATRG